MTDFKPLTKEMEVVSLPEAPHFYSEDVLSAVEGYRRTMCNCNFPKHCIVCSKVYLWFSGVLE